MKAVIWDWNGTLFNDVQVCINSMNIVLKKYGLPIIKGLTEYKSIFRFPVIEYYSALGFDFEKYSFEQVANEFISIYNIKSQHCKLNKNVREILEEISLLNVNQMIVSASKEENLKCQVSKYCIEDYFTEICGIMDVFAKSKYEIVEKAIMKNRYESNEVIMIGDTIHDYEIARRVGCRCILYNKGHQNIEMAEVKNAVIIGNLNEVIENIN